jgi:hypothetical protein
MWVAVFPSARRIHRLIFHVAVRSFFAFNLPRNMRPEGTQMHAENYVLFLDDERQPPDPKQWMDLEIVHAKTPFEFVTTIKERGAPFALLMDWYLGSGQANGLELARWLVEHDKKHDIIPEDMVYDSHSSDREKAVAIVRLIGDHIRQKFRPSHEKRH